MGNEIESIDSRMEQLDRVLAQYKEKFGLSKIKIQEVDLKTTIDGIKSLSPEDIGQKILEWNYYALALQVRTNEIRAKLTWVEANWQRYMGVHKKDIDRTYGYTAEDRKLLLLDSDEYAIKLFKLKTDMQIEIKQLEFIPNQINYLSKVAQQICDNKWRERNGNYRN